MSSDRSRPRKPVISVARRLGGARVDALPLGKPAVTNPVLLVILVLGAAVLATRKVESLWVILGSAALYLAAASVSLVSGL